jgi:hypothetical protein
MRSGYMTPKQGTYKPQTVNSALYWKAHDPLDRANAKRAGRILRDYKRGIPLSSGNTPFVANVVEEWLMDVEKGN